MPRPGSGMSRPSNGSPPLPGVRIAESLPWRSRRMGRSWPMPRSDSACGVSPRGNRSSPSRGISLRRCRFLPTERSWQQAHGTTPSSCGRWPPGNESPPSGGTRARSLPWPSPATGRSPPGRLTRRSGCGTSGPGSRPPTSRDMRMLSDRWRFLPTGPASHPHPRMVRSGYGTQGPGPKSRSSSRARSGSSRCRSRPMGHCWLPATTRARYCCGTWCCGNGSPRSEAHPGFTRCRFHRTEPSSPPGNGTARSTFGTSPSGRDRVPALPRW